MIITEKIDGTNAQIVIVDLDITPSETFKGVTHGGEEGIEPMTKDEYVDLVARKGLPAMYVDQKGMLLAGSRKRYLSLEQDNFGFGRWVSENRQELVSLGAGRHFGEWWGKGIQRKYGMDRKVFSLFNTAKWIEDRPECCDVVPVLAEGMFNEVSIKNTLSHLKGEGSFAAARYDKWDQPAEGIVVFHKQSNHLFKVTIENDEVPKGMVR
jgi:hypothetical protein